MFQVQLLEGVIPRLQALTRIEALLLDSRQSIPAQELRALLNYKRDDGVASTDSTLNAGDMQTSMLVTQAYAMLDQIRAGMSRSASLTSSELGHGSVRCFNQVPDNAKIKWLETSCIETVEYFMSYTSCADLGHLKHMDLARGVRK